MSADSEKVFFDTNILVYLQDSRDRQKQERARDLFSQCTADKHAVISTQVLQEFSNVCIRKLNQDKMIVKQIVHALWTNTPTVQINPLLIESAIEITRQTNFSLFDSLIIASAAAAGCSVLYTEDMNNGQTVNGVRIVNPFL
ncbi:MAG: PIN domain-containing protein [Treponema sp.]|nr:PIN domain-containing protein [Candidatus Treponema caballi]